MSNPEWANKMVINHGTSHIIINNYNIKNILNDLIVHPACLDNKEILNKLYFGIDNFFPYIINEHIFKNINAFSMRIKGEQK